MDKYVYRTTAVFISFAVIRKNQNMFPGDLESGPEVRRHGMKSFEENTHAFIVRVWLEPRELEGAAPECRWVIEHVPSGERRYLKDLSEAEIFISTCLRGMCSEQSKNKRPWSWLEFLKSCFFLK